MSTNPALSEDDPNVVELSDSPGRRLRVLRQSKGMEIARVAAQLHLRPPVVEALEQDRYEDLPPPVFVAGYLRNYARLLGVDDAPLVGAYRASVPDLEPPPPRIPTPSEHEIGGGGQVLVRLATLALVAGVIAMLVLWWQNRAELLAGDTAARTPSGLAVPSGDRPAADDTLLRTQGDGGLRLPPAVSPAPPPDGPAPGPAEPAASGTRPGERLPLSNGGGSAQPGAVLGEAGPGAASPALAGPPPAVAVPEPAAPERSARATPDDEEAAQPPAAAERKVELRFSGPCWIDVRDAAGRAVLTGEMKKGDARTLTGAPPYTFVIGNAGATTLTVGGEPFDLAARAKGNVARFKLDPAAE